MITIFSKIISKEIPAEIIYEDEKAIAIRDINPITPGHFLVIPKKHSTNLFDISDEELKYISVLAKDLAKTECEKLGVKGFKLQINNGETSGQEVMHTHIHIIPSDVR